MIIIASSVTLRHAFPLFLPPLFSSRHQCQQVKESVRPNFLTFSCIFLIHLSHAPSFSPCCEHASLFVSLLATQYKHLRYLCVETFLPSSCHTAVGLKKSGNSCSSFSRIIGYISLIDQQGWSKTWHTVRPCLPHPKLRSLPPPPSPPPNSHHVPFQLPLVHTLLL